MKIAFFDCFSGISGDMCLGAIVDAGLDIERLKDELAKLSIKDYHLISKKVSRNGISSTKVDVIVDKDESQNMEGRRWQDIVELINRSKFSEPIKEKGLHIFRRLFEAEAKVHGEPFESIHLHELGAVDCLVDIFGALIGLKLLQIDKVYVSKINLGSGMIKTSHGMLPVPAPATLELIKGYQVYSSGAPFELTTPTGAAILSGLDADSSPLPIIKTEKTGYGAGNKDIHNMPNVLRLVIGEETHEPYEFLDKDTVTVIEANIDDMNPQFYEDVMEKLFGAGALDVALENIIMKKGRPAIKLSIIAHEKDVGLLTEVLFCNTTTIGARFYTARRKTLIREVKTINTKLGDIRIKISKMGNKILNILPEYDDLKALSKKTDLPIKKINEMLLNEIKREDYKSSN